MSYGLVGLRREMESEALRGLGDLAGQQRQQQRAEEQMEAAGKQRQMSAIGAGAAIGMAAGPAGAVIGAGVGFLANELF
ncbi:hypothetical protein [uncultured Marinobacter sp.]|uniref:hypothetical protein n=1 Tax=uncultured Marinobacter sp. TaxID=187379 RepID=UPI002590B8C0|nr:hypothetical protein [uncultured Marinobacter sp.]